ncbi:MAG: transcriptional repressor [Ruminococcaceae bacterium]|nr:transcriptional repressor [Oscillospiraceae bacterium]
MAIATSGYKTKQRAIVEEALRQNNGNHITVEELTEQIALQGNAVGRTTVYRCLEKLVSEGRVQKYAAVGESACYQYLSDEGCHDHFHLKCVSCGKLIHIECEHITELAKHIGEEHGFSVDKLKTVLYGKCKECSAK